MRRIIQIEAHAKFLQIAKRVSLGSNCVRGQVGVVLVQGGKIVSTGWNGVPTSFRDCLSAGCPRCKHRTSTGRGYDRCICVHAEQSAIATAARNGIPLRSATMYVNLRPCLGCLNLALTAGVRKIVYEVSWTYPSNIEAAYERIAKRLSSFLRVDSRRNKAGIR